MLGEPVLKKEKRRDNPQDAERAVTLLVRRLTALPPPLCPP